MARTLVIRWLITSLVIFLIPYVLPGVHVPDVGAALVMAAVLGILNILVKPLLLILTLPLTFLTLGFFWFVINALMFEWAGHLVQGVVVRSFSDAFLASLIVSVVSWWTHWAFDRARRPVVRATVRTRFASRSETRDGDPIELRETDKGKWE